MLGRLIVLALFLLPLSAHADSSLSGANAPTVGSAVSFAQPASSVTVVLSYTGSGGEVDIEGSTDGVNFTPQTRVALDGETKLIFVNFGAPQVVGRGRPPPARGAPVVKVRANLVSLSGASAVSATIQ